MSVTKEQIDQALAVAVQHAYRPAFFDKLASFGIRPQNQAEAETLLGMATELREAGYTAKVAAAGTRGREQNRFAKIAGDLTTEVRGDQGEARSIAAAASDPAVYNAFLTLKKAVAQETVGAN